MTSPTESFWSCLVTTSSMIWATMMSQVWVCLACGILSDSTTAPSMDSLLGCRVSLISFFDLSVHYLYPVGEDALVGKGFGAWNNRYFMICMNEIKFSLKHQNYIRVDLIRSVPDFQVNLQVCAGKLTRLKKASVILISSIVRLHVFSKQVRPSKIRKTVFCFEKIDACDHSIHRTKRESRQH